MEDFTFSTDTEAFGHDSDQSVLLCRVNDKRSRSFRVVSVVLVLMAAVLVVLCAPILMAGAWDLGLMFLLMLATVVGMLLWILTDWSVRGQIKAGRKQRQAGGVFDRQITITLNNEGGFLKVEPDGKQSKVFVWENVGQILESEKIFLLMGRRMSAFCLRKSALRERSADELRDYLGGKCAASIKKYEIETEKLQGLLK